MIRINHHDTLLNRTFNIPCFDGDNITPDDLLFKYSDEINDAIYESLIILANNPNWQTVPCFVTSSSDPSNEILFDIKRESFENQLEPCLAHYSKSQDYEICADLQRLREILSNS